MNVSGGPPSLLESLYQLSSAGETLSQQAVQGTKGYGVQDDGDSGAAPCKDVDQGLWKDTSDRWVSDNGDRQMCVGGDLLIGDRCDSQI